MKTIKLNKNEENEWMRNICLEITVIYEGSLDTRNVADVMFIKMYGSRRSEKG